MKKNIRLIAGFLLFYCTILSAGEWTSYAGWSRFSAIAANYQFVYLGTNNGLVIIDQNSNLQRMVQYSASGLPGNVINDVFIDDTGLLWIGTNNGLAAYNQVTWTLYNTSNSNISSNIITHITRDTSGALWLGHPHGISSFKNGLWTKYTAAADSLPSDSILSLSADSAGNIYAGSVKGLLKFNGTRWSIYDTATSNIPQDIVTALTSAPNGVLWVGTLSRGLASLTDSVWTIYDTVNSNLPLNGVTALMCDENGSIWVGLSDNLAIMERDTFAIRASSHAITDLAATGTGRVWYVTNNYDVDFFYDGPRMFSSDDKRTFAQKAVSLPSLPLGTFGNATGDFEGIVFDPQGKLWAATSNGLLGFAGQTFTLTSLSLGGSASSVDLNTVAVDSSGIIWGGSSGMYGGLGSLSGTVKTPYHISDYVRAISVDQAGKKWVVTGSNLESSVLHELDGTTGNQYAMTLANPWAVEPDRSGNIWVGFESGLLKFTSQHAWESVNFSGGRVNALKIDAAGNLWVGTAASGLLFYDTQTKQWTAYNKGNSGIPSNTVTDLVIQSNQVKWVGTAAGMARFSYGVWEVYDSSNSALPSNYVQALGLESDSKVWIGTGQGLLLYDDGARSINVEEDRTALNGLLPEIGISPNPFSARTAICINLGEKQRGKASGANIYSVTGRLVGAFPLNTETFQKIDWNGKDLNGNNVSAGLYIVQVNAVGPRRAGSKLLKIR